MIHLQSKIAHELAPLRKGIGITPLKLRHTPNIRIVVAHAIPSSVDTLTDSQVYNFLLTELSSVVSTVAVTALKNAFGINSSLKKLSERRADFATIIGKHTDTIERYENEGINQLAASLAERHLRTQAADIPSSLSYSYLRDIESQAKATRTMTTIGLASHLSLTSHEEDLMNYLEMPRKPYMEASVHITLLPSSRGEKWYRFRTSYLFQGGRESFRVAVVLNSADGEQLMANGLVDDYHRLDNPDNPMRDIKIIIANSKFTIRNPNTNTQKLLRFHETPPEQAHQVLTSVSKSLSDPCWLLQISIPPKWQTPECTYEYLGWINLQIASVAYWYSPTLMYLKKLTLDFSQFPEATKRDFFLLPFLGHAPGTEQTEKYLYTLNLNNWIMPGHGIVLGWQSPSEPPS